MKYQILSVLLLVCCVMLLTSTIIRKQRLNDCIFEIKVMNAKMEANTIFINEFIKNHYMKIDSLNDIIIRNNEIMTILNNEVAKCHNRSLQSHINE